MSGVNRKRITRNGKTVQEHRLIAEKVLGRLLTSVEVVHHIDQMPHNNDPENLMVFSSSSDHSRFHQYECDSQFLIDNNDGTFSCSIRPTGLTCFQCGTEILTRRTKGRSKNVYCSEKCRSLSFRKVQRPDKETLQLQVNGLGYRGTGKLYGVSDNTIRKWLKRG